MQRTTQQQPKLVAGVTMAPKQQQPQATTQQKAKRILKAPQRVIENIMKPESMMTTIKK